MLEFLQAYGLWIVLGGAFLFLMMRGGGCGMGHSKHQGHDDRQETYRPFTDTTRRDDATSQTTGKDVKTEDARDLAGKS